MQVRSYGVAGRMSKGSNRRPEDYQKVSDNWEKIFGKSKRCRETVKRSGADRGARGGKERDYQEDGDGESGRFAGV